MRRQDTSAWTGRRVSGSHLQLVAGATENFVHKLSLSAREHIPYRDALTNLPNRFLLADRLRQALLQSQRRRHGLAVAYLDLDLDLDLEGIKNIHETHGRGVHDDFLVSIAQRMRQVMREGDTLARLKNDEFVAVLVDLTACEDSEVVLNRLVVVASDPVAIGEVLLHVKVSIGITLYPQGVEDADLLLRHAEQAFCSTAVHGRGRYQMFDIDLTEFEAARPRGRDAGRNGDGSP